MAEKKTTDVRVPSNVKFMEEMDALLKRVDKAVDLGQAFFDEINVARIKPEGIIGRLSASKMKEVERGVKEVLDECMDKPSVDLPFMGKPKPSQETSKFETASSSKRRKIKV
ncbi:MAG TPA: hypothetical protein PLV25_07825 [Opitutales bacterium]|nr:hypothetical protein [Opitutales bacterium]